MTLRLFLVALAAAMASGASADHPVQRVDYHDVNSNIGLRDVLANEGLVVMTNVPGLAAARELALVESAKCVLAHGGSSVAPVSLALRDSTTRSSWAAFTGSEMANTQQCAGLQQAMEDLRRIVDAGSLRFVQMLDKHVLATDAATTTGLMSKTNGGKYSTFTDLLMNSAEGTHLDHIHVYEKQVGAGGKRLGGVEEDAALEMHTDQGIFIAIVPSIRVDKKTLAVNKEEQGFVVQMKEGQATRLALPDEGDILLFMMGDGANYLRATELRAVPHALILSSADSARAWFGRMFFAPEDAILNAERNTFQSIVATAVESRRALSQGFPTLGCSSGGGSSQQAVFRRELHDPTGHNCSHGTAYCWMACRSTANLTCENPVCISNKTGLVWEDCPTCRDMTARLVCSNIITPGNDSSSGAMVHASSSALMALLLAAVAMLWA